VSLKSAYPVPDPLGIPHETYIRWLRRKAQAHLRRDRKRVEYPITGQDYRERIHAAVCDHGTHDYYTGEKLDWSKVSTYDNEKSAQGRSGYKAGFADLPTVDHVGSKDGRFDFVICGWRVNAVKNDLSHDEFLEVCRKVIAKADTDRV